MFFQHSLPRGWCLRYSPCRTMTVYYRVLGTCKDVSSSLTKDKSLNKVKKMAKIRNRYNKVPHLTHDTTWESDKNTINITNKSQEVSPFPAGHHKAAMNRRESMTNKRHTRDVRKELLISIWRLQISSKPKSAHSMPSKNSPWLEMQSFNRCIHFLKASRYADLGTVIRY